MSESLTVARLEADELRGDEIVLRSIRGHDAISQLFELTLEAAVLDPSFEAESLLTESAQLVFSRHDEELCRMAGLVREVTHSVADSDEPLVVLTFVPRAYSTAMRSTLDIYVDQSVPDAVRAVLTRAGLAAGDDFDLDRLEIDYPEREFVVQYQETDLAFISRVCEHLGIFFYVDHAAGIDQLVFGDTNAVFRELERVPEVPFGSRTDAPGDYVFAAEVRTKTLPARYIVRDYNYRMPSVNLLGEAEVDPGGLGEVVEYGTHFMTPGDGTTLATVRAQELRAGQRVYHGKSTVPDFAAGKTFLLLGHNRGDVELLITRVEHHFEGTTSGRTGAYRNTFTAIEKAVPYRPPRVTPKPRVGGVLTGVIDAAARGDYAEIDDEGRYRVTFYYDTADREGGRASGPVRMATPHSGAGYGMHFPLRPGTEVIVNFEDGDPDRPVIAGTVPNPETSSPVGRGNNTRNIIRTGGGTEIDIDDTAGSQKLIIRTEGSTVQYGRPEEPGDGHLLQTDGDSVSVAEKVIAAVSAVGTAVHTSIAWRAHKNITHIAKKGSILPSSGDLAAIAGAAKDAVQAGLEAYDAILDATGQGEETAADKAKAYREASDALIGEEYDEQQALRPVRTGDGQIIYVSESEEEWRRRRESETAAQNPDGFRQVREMRRDALEAQAAEQASPEPVQLEFDGVTLTLDEVQEMAKQRMEAKEAQKVWGEALDEWRGAEEFAVVMERNADIATIHHAPRYGRHKVAPGMFAAPYHVSGSAHSMYVYSDNQTFVHGKLGLSVAGTKMNVVGAVSSFNAKVRSEVAAPRLYFTGKFVDTKADKLFRVHSDRDTLLEAEAETNIVSKKDLHLASETKKVSVTSKEAMSLKSSQDSVKVTGKKSVSLKAMDKSLLLYGKTLIEAKSGKDVNLSAHTKRSIVSLKGDKVAISHEGSNKLEVGAGKVLVQAGSKMDVADNQVRISTPKMNVSSRGTVSITGSKIKLG